MNTINEMRRLMANGNNNQRGPKRQPEPGRTSRGNTDRPYGRARTPFQWGDLSANEVGEFVQSVTSTGAAVILGTTSDAGALSVTILQGEERIRDWPSTPEEFQKLAEWVREGFAFV
jgi:hypothetical protein